MDVFPNTVILTGFALMLAYIWGVLMGSLLAWRRGRHVRAAACWSR